MTEQRKTMAVSQKQMQKSLGSQVPEVYYSEVDKPSCLTYISIATEEKRRDLSVIRPRVVRLRQYYCTPLGRRNRALDSAAKPGYHKVVLGAVYIQCSR